MKEDTNGKCIEDACVGETLVATSPEWGPYVVPALGAAFNIAGTYFSNYLQHQPTSVFEVVTSGTTGAAFPALFGDTLTGLFASGFTTQMVEDLSAKRKFSAGSDVVSGLTSSATAGIFRWGVGAAPLEESVDPSAQSIFNNLRYQTVLNTFQTSYGAVTQNSYSNSSFSNSVQQTQNFISSAVQSGAAKIGNAIGSFIGTYNFGSGIGTYNAGTGQWSTSK